MKVAEVGLLAGIFSFSKLASPISPILGEKTRITLIVENKSKRRRWRRKKVTF